MRSCARFPPGIGKKCPETQYGNKRETIKYRYIYCEKNYIIVKNNLQKMTTLVDPSKIGLKNLAERIKLITGKELLVNETANEFIVKMPIF